MKMYCKRHERWLDVRWIDSSEFLDKINVLCCNRHGEHHSNVGGYLIRELQQNQVSTFAPLTLTNE
jgi:hypothetical protein